MTKIVRRFFPGLMGSEEEVGGELGVRSRWGGGKGGNGSGGARGVGFGDKEKLSCFVDSDSFLNVKQKMKCVTTQ